METGTLLVMSVMDLAGAPGVRTAEEGDELRKRLTELTAETNRVSPLLPANELSPFSNCPEWSSTPTWGQRSSTRGSGCGSSTSTR